MHQNNANTSQAVYNKTSDPNIKTEYM